MSRSKSSYATYVKFRWEIFVFCFFFIQFCKKPIWPRELRDAVYNLEVGSPCIPIKRCYFVVFRKFVSYMCFLHIPQGKKESK